MTDTTRDHKCAFWKKYPTMHEGFLTPPF